MGELQMIGLICLVIGIGFMIAEIFIPSFGVAGGIGFLAMTLGIIMTAGSFAEGLLFFAIMLIGSVIFLVLGYHIIGNSKITLKNNLKEDEKPDYSHLIGKKGRAFTPLRPSGVAELEGQRYDVLTKGEFIETNEEIKVISIENNHIFIGRA